MADAVELAPEAASVSAARRFVAERLALMELPDLVDTAVLLASELVTNSVLHARTDIVLTVDRLEDERVEIQVRDGSRFSPRRRRHAHDATTGRGIELLDKLAQSWQVAVDETGKTIRFVVAGGSDPWQDVNTGDLMDAEL